MVLNRKFIILVSVVLFLACEQRKEKEPVQSVEKVESAVVTPNKKRKVIDVNDEQQCMAFVEGKVFTCDNLSLKFQRGSNLEYYGNGTIQMNGTWELGEKYLSTQRVIRITDSQNGRGKLFLGEDGKIMDEATFKIFKPE